MSAILFGVCDDTMTPYIDTVTFCIRPWVRLKKYLDYLGFGLILCYVGLRLEKHMD